MNEYRNKNEIRKIIRGKRRSLSAEQIAEISCTVFSRVLEMEEYQACKSVFLYMSMPMELQTRPVIERIWADGKRAAVPKVQGKDLRFYYLTDFGQLRPGTMNILEPDEGCPESGRPDESSAVICADNDEHALMIMPGLAFDRQRNRIGYGGGFYDRYLAEHREHRTIAAAADFQVFDEVPHEDYDHRPDILVTETLLIRGQ